MTIPIAKKSAFWVSMVVLCMVVTAYGDVYDDAIFWFWGGTNVTANGRTAVKGDLFDSIHANDPSHKNHTATFFGYEDCRVLRYEDVQFPCNRDDRKSVPVLHLPLGMKVSNGGATTNLFMAGASAHFLYGQISNEYTVVMRLRREAGYATNTSAWVTRFGYNGATGGILFGFMHDRNNNDLVYPSMYCASTNTSTGATGLQEYWFRSLPMPPTNKWFDISLAVSGSVVRVGLARPAYETINGSGQKVVNFQTATATMIPDPYQLAHPVSSEGSWRFFMQASASSANTPANTSRKDSFVGSVQQVAVWNRTLTDDEVHEAWGWPHEKVFKVGLENGASNEFGSNAAPAVQTIDAYGPLGEKSPNIPPGGTWTVTFFGATNEVGLAQLLTLTATAGSAVGTISASVNGTSVGSQTVQPGRTATWYVPGTAFKKGPNNTLTLTRTGGSGNVVVDSLSIGGSWQIGISGSDWSDMSSEGYVPRAPVTSTFDISRKHWAQAANSGSWTSNRTFRVWLPEHVAANYPMEFDLRSAYYFNGSSPTNYFMEVFVNGQVRNAIRDDTGVVSNRVSITPSHKLYRMSFEPGELRAGWNEFFMHGHARPTGGYFMFDFYRFQITGNRKNGTLLIVR